MDKLTEEQVSEYNKLKAQKKKQLDRQNRYNKEKYERFNVVMRLGDKERVRAAARESGARSVNDYITKLIYADLEKGESKKESLCFLPEEIVERIKAQDDSINAYIIQAVVERLEADEDDFLQEFSESVEKKDIQQNEKKILESEDEKQKEQAQGEHEETEKPMGSKAGLAPEELNKKFHEVVAKKRADQGLPEKDEQAPSKKQEEELPKTPVYYDANGEVIEDQVEYLKSLRRREYEEWKKNSFSPRSSDNEPESAQLPDFMQD